MKDTQANMIWMKKKKKKKKKKEKKKKRQMTNKTSNLAIKLSLNMNLSIYFETGPQTQFQNHKPHQNFMILNNGKALTVFIFCLHFINVTLTKS